MPLLSRLRTLSQRDSSTVMELSSPQLFHRLLTPPLLEVAGLPAPGLDVISLSQHHAQIARVLQPLTSSACPWLSTEDLKLIGVHPIAAGGFADILEATYDGRKVVLKSYRCHMMTEVAHVVRVSYVYNPC